MQSFQGKVAVAAALAAGTAAVWYYLSKNSKTSGPQKVAILDAGAQYGKLIDRRVRELNVESEVLPLDTPPEKLKGQYGAIIISGGPGSCYEANAPAFNNAVLDMGLPVLGVCYGYQLINYVSGGKVEKAEKREDKQESIRVDTSSMMFAGLEASQRVLLTHGDAVTKVAPTFRAVGWTGDKHVVALENASRMIYGVQFHPEVDLSDKGSAMFENFLFGVAKLQGNYTPKSRHQHAIDEIKQAVGDKEILVLVSGGVDSSVCAALCREAVGADKVHAVHVDHGFMRQEESSTVEKALGKVGIHLHVVNCTKEFAEACTEAKGRRIGPLIDTVSPEDKRMIIGDTFMKVTETAVASLKLKPENVFLAQGTLRPDLIESGSHLASSKADVIKTHHNDTALVRQLRAQGKIVEPLRDYHKDEVRALGTELGLPKHLVWRQPFPGPGLAIRVLCSDGTVPQTLTPEEIRKVAKCIESYKAGTLAFTVLPVRTVGVQGDCRSYKAAIALTLQGNPDASAIDWEGLFKVARQIPSEVHNVSRTCFMFGPVVNQGDEGAEDVTPTYCTQAVMDQLRAADHIVSVVLLKNGLHHTLSQVPVVLFPASFGVQGNRSVALRPFITRDFMTGTPAVPGKDLPFSALTEMVNGVQNVPGISKVVYDLTAKPPGTTEWE